MERFCFAMLSEIGIDGVAGSIADAKAAGVWEPLEVKEATLKTAMGCATLLLRIDEQRGDAGGL